MRFLLLSLLSMLVTLPALAADPAVLKVATVAPEDSPWAEGLRELKKQVEAAHPGKIKFKLFLGGTLGDENETVMSCKRGQLQAVGASNGALASVVPELNVLELPYLFDRAEEADHVLDKVVGQKLEQLFLDRGLVLVMWSENGYRSYGGKFAVHSPADLKGKKIRSQENQTHLATHRAFGASPVPIPVTEALHALQTGVIDGYDQTPLYTFAASWHTGSTHYSVTRHLYQPAAVVLNKASWDALPPAVRESIKSVGKQLVPSLRQQIRAMDPILIDNLGKSGIAVNVLAAAERATFAELAAKVRANYIKSATAGEKAIYSAIEAGLAELRGKK